MLPQTPKGALNFRCHVEPVETYSIYTPTLMVGITCFLGKQLRQAQCDKPFKAPLGVWGERKQTN
jgi:hypothetical protein